MTMPCGLGGGASFFRMPKRKLSGTVSTLSSDMYPQSVVEYALPMDDLVKPSSGDLDTIASRAYNGRSYSDSDSVASSHGASTASWFCGLCRTVDLREVAGFVVWEALTVLIVVLAVSDWIFFFKFVVEPEDSGVRARNGAVWATLTVLFLYFRQYVRSICSPHVRSLSEHAEIFVTVSLVMVFSTNIAFYIHAPSATPLRDLGFMMIPAQAEDSKWRPLSDLMTALLPIFFMLQSYLMTRENRCRVMSSFFRVATVSYALRTLTVALTSLPGPAPHCRPGNPLYLPPESWIDIVTRVGPMYGKFYSCGDLIFSGHMAYTNSALLLYLRTLDRYFVRFSRLRWFIGVSYLFALAALCISGRKHYTVDVMLGIVISTLVFFHFEHSWLPVCFQHPEAYALLVNRHTFGRRRGSSAASARTMSDMDTYDDDDLDTMKLPHSGGIVVVPDAMDAQLLQFRAGKAGEFDPIDFIC